MRDYRLSTYVRYYLIGLYREVWEKPIFMWAQAIAFKILVALIPFIILATGVIGLILEQERTFTYVETIIRELTPEFAGDSVIAFLSQLQVVGGRLTLIGGVGLVVTAVTLFTTLRVVLDHIFAEDWHYRRSPLRGYAFDFQMAFQTGFLFLSSIGLTVFLQTFGGLDLSRVGFTWIEQLIRLIGQGLLYVLPVALSIAMFFQLYLFIPAARPPKRSAFAGALFAAGLWEAAKVGMTEYATRFGLTEGWTAALGDTFMFVLLLVIWGYYSALVFNLGALVVMLYEKLHRLPAVVIPTGDIIVESASTEIFADAAHE